MTRKVSLKDIAIKVGVSTALVSYVLNNKKEGRINKDVAIRIRETAKLLNYRTNQIAKSLKTSKTNTIGLIVADISNPFSSALARIIEDEAEKDQYTVLFGSSDESIEKLEKLIGTFINRCVDGLIIAPGEHSESQITYLQQQEIPFVLIDRYYPEMKTNYVAIDNHKASVQAVQHMVDQGYQKIAMITYKSNLFHLQERRGGYEAGLRKNGIQVKKSWIKEIPINHINAGVDKALNELLALAQPPDAILLGSNRITILTLKYCNARHLKVPTDIALVGFDESEAQDLFYSPLTFIRQPLQEMGQKATKILIECIEKNNRITQVNMDTELVIRSSTGSAKPGVAAK